MIMYAGQKGAWSLETTFPFLLVMNPVYGYGKQGSKLPYH